MNETVPTAIESYIGKAIEKAIDNAVSKAVEKCFESNFARLAAMFEVLDKDKSKGASTSNDTMIEKRVLIDTQEQVEQLNVDLRDNVLQTKYVSNI